MYYTLENFTNYCENNQIANESFSSIKSKIVTLFSKLVLAIEGKVKQMKDSKVKSTLMTLLSRAKTGLSKSKSLNEHNPEMVKKLQEEAQDIQKEMNDINKYKYFNPSNAYDNAIKNNDTGALKALLCGIIGSDPTFATSEFEEACSYISKNMDIQNLYEQYKMQDDEYFLNDRNEWTKQYFGLLLVWLRGNFALSKRLPHIQEVGKYVYKDESTYGKSKKRSR